MAALQPYMMDVSLVVPIGNTDESIIVETGKTINISNYSGDAKGLTDDIEENIFNDYKKQPGNKNYYIDKIKIGVREIDDAFLKGIVDRTVFLYGIPIIVVELKLGDSTSNTTAMPISSPRTAGKSRRKRRRSRKRRTKRW